MPPRSNHIDLSVGDPVKKREKPDAAEFEESTPKIMSPIPMANNASPMALFIIFSVLWPQSQTENQIGFCFHNIVPAA
jgi:hypothetical protein